MNQLILNEVKCLKRHLSMVTSLLILNDGRVASCSLDKTIQLFSPKNDYQYTIALTGHKEGINSICQLDNENIVSCSDDKSIKIWDCKKYKCVFTIDNAHEDKITKVVVLSFNRFASSSNDSTIKIWKGNLPYSDIPIKVLRVKNTKVSFLLFIKDKDILISCLANKILQLWSMKTYQCISSIRGAESNFLNSLYQFDNEHLILGANKKITLVNITKCLIEKIENLSEYVLCFIKHNDNTRLICGCDDGKICVYNMNTKEYCIIQTDHTDTIPDIKRLNENTLISCSWEKTIRIWNYNN